ncbi:MAG: DUF5681 domain-containing protein [Nitrospinaceae bacterium]
MAVKKAPKPSKKPANAAGKQRGRPFKKGASGNPAGKKPGTRHRATAIAEQLLDGQVEGLVKKVVEMALEGDTVALKLCLERIIPARKSRQVNIPLPEIRQPSDVVAAMASVLAGVGEGQIDPDQGQALAGIIDGYRKILETAELEQRISNLEESARLK